MVRFRQFVLALMLTLLASSCASGGEGTTGFCDGLCAGLSRCSLTDAGCSVRCVDNYHPTGVRTDALGAIGSCLSDESCDVLSSADPVTDCFERVARDVPLRPALVSYCKSAARNDYRCNIFFSVDECTASMGLWEDSVLGRAQACHENACASLSTCEKAVFDAP